MIFIILEQNDIIKCYYFRNEDEYKYGVPHDSFYNSDKKFIITDICSFIIKKVDNQINKNIIYPNPIIYINQMYKNNDIETELVINLFTAILKFYRNAKIIYNN